MPRIPARKRSALAWPTDAPGWTITSPINSPIPANPVLDPQSAGIVALLAAGTKSLMPPTYATPIHIADRGTPRWPLVPTESGNWGGNPFAGQQVPIDPRWLTVPVAKGGDGHLAIYDPGQNVWFGLWDADLTGGTPTCRWGGWQTAGTATITDVTGGTATAAGFARAAGVITEAEVAAGRIDHALVFSSDVCRPGATRFPAVHTDATVKRSGTVDQAATITQGARVQLDPGVDVSALLVPAWAKAVARALQVYGAYCIDNGGAAAAFAVELPHQATFTGGTVSYNSPAYQAAGLTESAYSLAALPWDRLRVLAKWDGS